MKKLLAFILALLVLGAAVPGCRHALRYDGRLTAADSLMKDAADSALALLEDLSPGELHSGRDSAYRDLLLTQARYKAYVTATSDSDINRALAWFRAHPADREKLTRAYIYKGAVMDELGHPDSAMLYYKHAETTAAPDDYNNLGYINLRIANLYQNVYFNDSAVVSRMRNASSYYSAIRDTSYLITTIGTQGLFDEFVGSDSARFFLEKALSLGKAIQSPSRFFYQSKLAGHYFYNNNYSHAKDLSLDIILNGKDYCDEDQFFYYAARSYVKLHHLDSALWVKSMIPAPRGAVDSMNMHLLLAEISQALHDYRGFAYHSHQADEIDKHMMKASIKSSLSNLENSFDVDQHENELKADSIARIILVVGASLMLIIGLLVMTFLVIRRLIRRYESKMSDVKDELVGLLSDTEERMSSLESERKVHCEKLEMQSKELEELRKKNCKLESERQGIAEQVSMIVRHRNLALRELYDGMRVRVDVNKPKRIIPLVGMIKELNDKKRILHAAPRDSFWNNLKLSVDGEYQGIASYVENMYPGLSIKEHHLFWLMCAGFPNQIIKMCMNFRSDATVSNNKRRLMKEKMGLDVKFEEFIELYLRGKL